MKYLYHSIVRKFYAVMVSVIVIVPNIFVVILGIEDFPFTCAPMFSHYIGTETDLYVFKFEGINNKKRFLIRPEESGRPEAVLMRQFFSKVYRSKDEISPFGSRLNDNPEAFNARMTEFFTAYWKFLSEEKNQHYEQIDLILVKVTPSGEPLDSFPLGYFGGNDQRYRNFQETQR